VNTLLKAKASVNADGFRGFPLCSSAENGHLEVVNMLLEAHASVDADGCAGVSKSFCGLEFAGNSFEFEDGCLGTPLCVSAESGHLEVVKALLAARASVNVEEQGFVTPLLESAKNGHLAIVNELLGAGANPTIPDAEGRTPLSESLANGYTEIANALLSAPPGARIKRFKAC